MEPALDSVLRLVWLGARRLPVLPLFLVLSMPAASAPQGDTPYTVANYPVDATAQNAVRAKEQALSDGQQAAFRSLLKRIVPVTAYQRLKRLPPVKAAELIDGVAVRSERNSTTQYIATLDFSFQPQAVRNLLKREGIPFIDKQAPETVLVPAMRDTQGALSSGTGWVEAWSGLDLAHAISPVKMASLTPNIPPEAINALLSGDGSVDRVLAGEFKSDRVVVALAEVDKGGKKLTVMLAGTDAVGPFVLKRSYRLGTDPAYAMELSAVIALGILEGRWKAVQAASRGGVTALAEPGEPITMTAEFSTLGQWNDMRRQLLETPGVEDVQINGVSARSAEITLRFPGGAAQLAEALAPQRLSLRNYGGQLTLRSSF